ncbi:hypothetical protein NDK43_13890 [Neobacillus pocheonensis]|uniref:DNA primase/polymerase bifunctional N-terminal domain-containing protein n=1 Tax=Neobacillus pocheonensis TaxID=363869 RepID=A0ABT0WE25_9BACI|nr:hypothetical protein [Neobacillus pocheonensis]
MEFKEGQKHASKNADILDSHEALKDAGYILEETDLVIDIDNLPKETIKSMIDTFGIKTQIVWGNRGCHLYFLKSKNWKGKKDGLTALGFTAEYLTSKNRPNGVTIKQNGVLREIENEGVREPLPECLEPVKADPLFGLSEGDGRDSKLYAHKFKVNKFVTCKKS